MSLIPSEIEPIPCSSSFNDSSFQSMSLHDEFVLSGHEDTSGVGNSLTGIFTFTNINEVYDVFLLRLYLVITGT
jgi:hypothetical protein